MQNQWYCLLTLPASTALPRASSCSSINTEENCRVGSYSVSPNMGTYLQEQTEKILQEKNNWGQI